MARNSKFRGQLRIKLKKIQNQGPFCKKHVNSGPKSTENKGEIEEIRSLKVN
jgi:hypothetical protein